MISKEQKLKAQLFWDMHQVKGMFTLPNVWNVGSAYVFEKQGFKAIATSSAGVAYDLGYPDGEGIAFEDLLWVVDKIARRVNIPLSVDFERGYGETGEQVKANASRLLLAGAVGFNIEDGLPSGTLSPLALQLEKIKALVELKEEFGINFVLNARTCAYWLNVAGEEEKLQIALERGKAFMEAGADCVFIPGVMGEATVTELVGGINGPVNIILNGAFNDFAKLEKIGVRRLSVGSSPARYVYGKLIDQADKLRNGHVDELLANDFSYAKANAYFEKQ